MASLSRWIAPAVLAAGLGLLALAPTPARAQDGDDLVRVLVDVADVMFRSGTPYYRHGNFDYNDRLVVVRDRYGRPLYYRQVHRDYRTRAPYGVARGYRERHGNRQVHCNSHGKCKATYYDPRYDRHRGRGRDRWDGRRW